MTAAGNGTVYRYHSVEVLLLHWEEDDLQVKKEVNDLEQTFKSGLNFTTHAWMIPSADSEEKLMHRIWDFRRGKTDNDLLILYYGGHAEGNNYECIWAANSKEICPTLNWHNVQSTLLGSPANVLLVLDCCYATSAARSNSVGVNWFLGASSKESQAAGVSRNSFTSALNRELDLRAERYRRSGQRFTAQSVHSGLVLWERDLRFTPQLLQLSDQESQSIELTPLFEPPQSPQKMPIKRSTHEQPPKRVISPPMRLDRSFTVPPKAPPIYSQNRGIAGSRSSDLPTRQPTTIDLDADETQTLIVAGLPLPVEKMDLIHWFEQRLGQRAVISKIGPFFETPGTRISKETTITFSTLALATQARNIEDRSFQANARSPRAQIKIDGGFQGLTCIYASPNKIPSIDIVLIHGAYSHAIRCFATQNSENQGQFLWPSDALAKALEPVGIYPRIMTYGWQAEKWLDAQGSVPNSEHLTKTLKERSMGANRPLFLIAHGVGGLLAKQFVTETVNLGFNFEDFENPIKGCFFFAVPNSDSDLDDGYAYVLASMQSVLLEDSAPRPALIRALKSRNWAISSLTTEFDGIRLEYAIDCITFSAKQKTKGCAIVSSDQGVIANNDGSTYQIDADYTDVVKLPGVEGRSKVVSILSAAICNKLGVSLTGNADDLNLTDAVTEYPIRRKKSESEQSASMFVQRPIVNKERVYAQLKRYDTSILIDDSDSMDGQRWKIAKEVLNQIVPIAVEYDKDGIDVRFFNVYLEEEERTKVATTKKVMDLFKAASPPEGGTPTADILEIELNEYLHKYREKRSIKGLNLIVLTDGEPSPKQDVEGVIVKYAQELKKLDAPPLQVGIQFVQIGSDEKAAAFLKTLDDDLKTKYNLDRDVSLSGMQI